MTMDAIYQGVTLVNIICEHQAFTLTIVGLPWTSPGVFTADYFICIAKQIYHRNWSELHFKIAKLNQFSSH